jgi:hypothetical protein
MAGKIRTLIESEEYARAFAKLGDAKRLDEAVNALTWGISIYPAQFPLVNGFKTIRVAKTDAVGDAPCLIIWFSILNPDEILLRFIEISKDRKPK